MIKEDKNFHMKKFIGTVLIACSLIAFSTSLQAQKIGYLDSGSLIAGMDATKAADSELKIYQDQLVKVGEEMASKFQKDVIEYSQQVQGGTMSPAQAQKREQELQAERQKIAAYEQEVLQKVQKKREDLYTPIVNKVNEAITAVGKEQGYQFIFDSSVYNILMFADESSDVMSLVKAKLGL